MPTAGRDDDSGDATAGGSASRSLSDAQIAGITDLVNSSEIEQAELAQSKSNDPKVLSFAKMMISHHTQAKQRQSSLGLSTAASPMLITLSQEGRQTLATLKAKRGNDFDRAYLQAQVEQHQKLLDSMDRQLLPSAEHPQFRAQLQGMKPMIQQHLEAARDAQQSLNTSGAKKPSGSSSGSSSGTSTGSGSGTTGSSGSR